MMRKLFSINPIILSVSKALSKEETRALASQIKQAVAETGDSMTVRQVYKAAVIVGRGLEGIAEGDCGSCATRAGKLADALLREDEAHEKQETGS